MDLIAFNLVEDLLFGLNSVFIGMAYHLLIMSVLLGLYNNILFTSA